MEETDPSVKLLELITTEDKCKIKGIDTEEYKEIIKSIKKHFDNIENSRVYTSAIEEIKIIRNKLMGKISIVEYTELLKDHHGRLEKLCKDKKFDKRKTLTIISRNLSTLEMRMLNYGKYTNTTLDIDTIDKFSLSIDLSIDNSKEFVPFDKNKIYNYINNYSLSLFTIKKCISRALCNVWGYNNMVYMNPVVSQGKDPYSFYILEKMRVTKKEINRCWKMECRLEDIAVDFVDNILPYCTMLFRQLYYKIFSDNDYREGYVTKSSVAEGECEQLLQNIIILTQPNNFCKMLQKIVVKNATFTQGSMDKINLYSNDRIQEKRLNARDDEKHTHFFIRGLFDNIKQEEVENIFYRCS